MYNLSALSLLESVPQGASSNAVFLGVSGMFLSACLESGCLQPLALELWLNPFSHTAGVRTVALHLCHSACMHNLRQPAAARHTFFKIRSRFYGKANACQCTLTNHLWKIAALHFFMKGKNFQRACTPTHCHKCATLKRVLTHCECSLRLSGVIQVGPAATLAGIKRCSADFAPKSTCPLEHPTVDLAVPRPARTAD